MKTTTLSIRVEESLVERLDAFEARTGIERASLVRASLAAVLDYFEQTGGITFPLRIVSQSSTSTALAEGRASAARKRGKRA